jgi:hypothetical protein
VQWEIHENLEEKVKWHLHLHEVVGQAGTSACFKLKNKEGTASG